MKAREREASTGWAVWLLRFGVAFVILNALLTLDNLDGTLWPRPTPRLSFELCMAVLVLMPWVALRGRAGAGVLRALAAITTVWATARYLDVTVRAVFGRPVNLYWDGRHVAELLRMGDVAGWQAGLGAVAAIVVIWLVDAVAHRCWQSMARALAWPPPRPAVGLAGVLLLASFAVHGWNGLDTRWFFSIPVAPTIARQAALLSRQLLPGQVASQLSASPAFEATDLVSLHGADVLLIFAESYGVCTLDDPRQAAQLAPARAQFAEALKDGGRQVVSARFRSPTYGGGSWLAHAALLSGVDTRDPGDYELLLSTDRPTLVRHFRQHGYRTVNWMPGLQRPWPEGSFYGFDRYADANSMGYRGPSFGYWHIPDQASMALLQAQELAAPAGQRPPRFIVFPTLASHAPFRPLAPYVADWARLLRDDAYTSEQAAEAEAEPVSWLEPVPAYVASLRYTFRWLGDYLAGRAPAKLLTIVIGDHQPLASVSGKDASWEVPVHIISADTALLQRFEALGFTPGLLPMQPATAGMQALAPLLLRAFDGPARDPASAAE
ncbi:Phosphoglycerol transferase, alkaline phosphatase superfamily [Variovorax sp. SRS16]|uniref:sulfatase-like hydrolase/transferase n=1 Tax=Variovorax sp. SRS16 TaxID=282217 RepID=UPI001316F2C3|nr:sulfatase-like hydrolase/transferase [Variovorax sp. SRS16]VTU26263.1 Phosphoglycerol transferase, alkaline phosphatase superfamily [Variovorax sp. SRS16]